MGGREPTIGELAEDIQDLTAVVRELVDRMERTYVRIDVYQAQQDAVRAEQARQASSIQWATRTAVSALLLPILVTVITVAAVGALAP
jgi:outer membrane murein-binding lipoprotein Lpp